MLSASHSFGGHGFGWLGGGKSALPPALTRKELHLVHSYCANARKAGVRSLLRRIGSFASRLGSASLAKG